MRSDDRAAFRTLVERYEPSVAATVVGMLGPGPDAEDVGQETFIRFYQALDRFRGDSSVGTYLTRIAINLSLNVLKRRRRRRLLFLDPPATGSAGTSGASDAPAEGLLDRKAGADPLPDARLESAEQETMAREALATLADDQRAVIVLRLVEGKSTRETAEILGLPTGTVLSRLSRAITQLKNKLAPYL